MGFGLGVWGVGCGVWGLELGLNVACMPLSPCTTAPCMKDTNAAIHIKDTNAAIRTDNTLSHAPPAPHRLGCRIWFRARGVRGQEEHEAGETHTVSRDVTSTRA